MKRKTSDSSTVSRAAGVLGARGAVRLTILMVLLSGHLYASERTSEWVQQTRTANVLVERGDMSEAGCKPRRDLRMMGSLGVILAHKQEFAEAEQVWQKTAELDAAGSTEMQEVRAVAMANLAGIQSRGGRTAEAVTSYREALSIMEALPDPSPATLWVALADYAGVLHDLGDNDAAGAIYRRAIDIAQSRLGPVHPILGGLLQKYSELQRRSGNKAEARATANDARRFADESRRENLTGHTIPIEALMVNK